MTRTDQTNLVTIRGVLVPVRWSDEGEITAIGISGVDECDYLIKSSHSIDYWLSLLRNEVEILGVIAGEDQGLKVIDVHYTRLLASGYSNEDA